MAMINLIERINYYELNLDLLSPNYKYPIILNFDCNNICLNGVCLNFSKFPLKPILFTTSKDFVQVEVNLNCVNQWTFFWLHTSFQSTLAKLFVDPDNQPSRQDKQKIDISFNLTQPNTVLTMYNLIHLNGNKQVKNHLTISHLAPNCSSLIISKSVLDAQSQFDFYGKIYVQNTAYNTDAKLTNQNILLSDQAKVSTKPELEIYCDEVKCTHGATIGKFDQNQDFYLQTRGLDQRQRQEILTQAFFAEIVEIINK